MKKPYAEELKRLVEIEKQLNPRRMVTVTMPDGTEKEMRPIEFWTQRSRFIDTDERGVTHYRARVEGLSPELFSLLLMENQADGPENEGERRHLFNFLTIFFGETTATQIMNMKGDQTNEQVRRRHEAGHYDL